MDIEAALLERLTAVPEAGSVAAGTGCAAATEGGPARAENQDRALLARLADGAEIAAVADGMGGMRDGGGCAAQALVAFVDWIQVHGPEPHVAALEHANARVFNRCGGAGGTTLTAVVVPPGGVPWLAHTGDSRAYALRADSVAEPCSRDHNALAELGKGAAGLSRIERLQLGAQITCAVGIEPSLSLAPTPLAAETFLLTTDGVHDFAPDALARLRAGSDNPEESLTGLLRAARDGASHDDATALYFVPGTLPETGAGAAVWAPGYADTPWRW